jgi:hypothetical protein
MVDCCVVWAEEGMKFNALMMLSKQRNESIL